MAWVPVLGNLKLPAWFTTFLTLLFVKGERNDLVSSPDNCIWSTTTWRLVLAARSSKTRPGEESKP